MYASDIENVLVEHHERFEGKSNYNIKRILHLISRLLLNYSSYPLQVLCYFGFGVSFISFALGTIYLISAILGNIQVPGWASLIVLVSFLCGFIIVILGVIGEYLSRILEQVSTNQSYHVKKIVG